jgi:hypothetical protein
MFNQVIDDLKRVDVKFEDKDKAYENLLITLTWGKESLELEDVIGALLTFH